MKRSIFAFLGATMVVALAACGGSDNGPTFATTVDSASATAAGEDGASFASDVASSIVNGDLNTDIGSLLPLAKGVKSSAYVEQLLSYVENTAYRRAHRVKANAAMPAAPLMRSAPFQQCVPTISGINPDSSAVDADDDGIPDDLRVTFPANCIDEDSAGTVTTLYAGSVRIRDMGGVYAYRLDVGNLKVKNTDLASGDYEQIGVNGFETGTYTASLISHQTDMTYALTFSGSGAPASAMAAGPMTSAPVTGTLSFVYKENTSYDPDANFVLGDPVPSGDLTFTFDYRILVSSTGQPDQNFRFTMSTATPLHFDNSSCHDIASGHIHGLLNTNADVGFDVNWTGCGTYEVTVFGTTEVS